MSHVVRNCPVCGQRFVGGRSARTCSRTCDERPTAAPPKPPVLQSVDDAKSSPRDHWTRPAPNRRSPAAEKLAELREALRASVRQQLEDGRRRAAS